MLFRRQFFLSSVKYALTVSCMTALVACAQSTTHTPSVSDSEVARERKVQEEYAKRGNSPKTVSVSLKAAQQRLDKITAKVQPAALSLCQNMQKKRCEFDVVLGEENGLNAYADGEKVVVLPGMIGFASKDSELAYIISHELAHNIMAHPDSTRRNATIGGLIGTLAGRLAESQGLGIGNELGKLGAQGAVMAYSKEFEREADYVGMYILARSGYDVSEAPDFWRKMSAINSASIYAATTHPTNPERFIQMQKTIDEISYKKSNNLPLLPEKKADGRTASLSEAHTLNI